MWPLAMGPTVWMASVIEKEKNRISKLFFTFHIIGTLFQEFVLEPEDTQAKKY